MESTFTAQLAWLPRCSTPMSRRRRRWIPKFNLFVRLWKKLDWSIDEVDQALQVLFPRNLPAWTGAGFAAAFGWAWIIVSECVLPPPVALNSR